MKGTINFRKRTKQIVWFLVRCKLDNKSNVPEMYGYIKKLLIVNENKKITEKRPFKRWKFPGLTKISYLDQTTVDIQGSV